jgi:hypothetical protein
MKAPYFLIAASVVQMIQMAMPGGALADAVADASASNSLTSPAWKNDILAGIRFDSRGDRRVSRDADDFVINEQGLIPGSQMLQLVAPSNLAALEVSQRGDVLKDQSEAALALMALGRILDHEAMKRRARRDVSDDRVQYVMRAVLTQNAANLKKVRVRELPRMTPDTCLPGPRLDQNYSACRPQPVLGRDGKPMFEHHPDESLALRPNAELYGWFKEAVGKNDVTINFDWQYDEGGTAFMKDGLAKSSKEPQWPTIALKFKSLPATWQEFREVIRAQLQPAHRKMMRSAMMDTLVMERNRAGSLQSMFAASADQMQRMLDSTPEEAMQIERMRASYLEISAVGDRSIEFVKRYEAALATREKQVDEEFRIPDGTQLTTELYDRFMKRSAELRASVPREVFAQVKRDLGLSDAEASLSEGHQDRSVDGRKPSAPANTRLYVEGRLGEALFSDSFGGGEIFERLSGPSQQGGEKLFVLTGKEMLEPIKLSKASPEVRGMLRARISSKLRGLAYRQVAFELLRDNRVQLMVNTCEQPEWPCLDANAQRSTETLFPETLFPGSHHPDGIRSSLGHPELSGNVMEIASGILDVVYGLPNSEK